MQKKYKLSSETAGKLFGIPYTISAACTPFVGFFVDKFGRRVIFITISNLILILAFSISIIIPDTEGSKLEIVPLVLVGIGYTVYCGVIWGSMPYTVPPQTVGTAFGIATAIQNIGLVVAPYIVAYIKENTTKTYGYYWVLIFFILVNVLGLICNSYSYYIDIKFNDGILNRVDKGEAVQDLMKTPTIGRKQILKESMAKSLVRQQLTDYKLD